MLKLLCILTAAANTLGAVSLHILMQFEATPSAIAVHEMEREMDILYSDVHVAIAWHQQASYRSAGVAQRIVFVRFQGDCRAVSLPSRQAVVGSALASVNRVDGQLLPLVTVDCERIAGYIFPAMDGLERSHGDVALGRALARVLAHELYHYLTGTAKHTQSALFRASISPAALLAAQLKLGADEIAGLRKALAEAAPVLGNS
jgi:hypothetical protein